MRRRLALVALVLGAAAPPGPPAARPGPPPASSPGGIAGGHGAGPGAGPGGGASAVDTLLAALKAAPSEQAASALEEKLQAVWREQASPSVQILAEHAAQLQSAGKLDEAAADSDAALVLQPDDADLWRRRAEVRFAQGDDRGAFADLAQALTREKRLIPAWEDLSRFAEARHDPKRALAAWRKVLELDPKTDGGAKRLEHLQHLVNGEPI